MKKFFNEFKKFISKGNVMDLAVAFIIGVSFKAIVTSLVNDLIMPLVSLVVGEQGFGNYKYVITAADEANGIVENAIYYGRFIQSVLDFFIVAFVVFLMVRTINDVKDALDGEEEIAVAAAPPKPTTEDILLDIKQLLIEQKK
ncbi:large conductance mechanosensitive channel protein MscL [Candidatus Xianfuyuplasma coldseepsis]|uniref:Large-conductance mechanosensitive channel n=1 Tax=Candidatus Xianfuyuplasma coldseepsis TaxID=2782163 RepID=A0A7L7KNW8_9MOLU|nr:large conductance mechanosensitive channel protein MscL [Xianfuyuplasma coldseepsis]QMS84393.1 large conductance mechanosensitive channel protein MscL [Xianfuyuplasma coldseepsis]